MSANIVSIGDIFVHTLTSAKLTVWAVGRMVYMTTPSGAPYAVELTDLKQRIEDGEFKLVGKEKQQ